MRIGPLGTWEILIIVLVVLLFLGPRRLPEMARGIGQSVREFRKGIREIKDDAESDSPVESGPTRAASNSNTHVSGPRAEREPVQAEPEVSKT